MGVAREHHAKLVDLFTNRIAVTYLVAILLAILAHFHVALPASADAASMEAAILLGASAFAAVLRFNHPGEPGADAKTWWQSKTIITQIVASAFAASALLGKSSAALDQSQVVDTVLGIAAVVSAILGGTIVNPIAASANVVRAPAVVAFLAFAMALLGGCAANGGGTSIASAGVVSVDEARDFARAQLAFKSLQQVALAGIQNGVITGSFKETVIDLVDKGQALETAGVAAEQAADQPGVAIAMTALSSIIFQLNALGIEGN